jgi:N-acetylmuramoyl-L-alanine amidase
MSKKLRTSLETLGAKVYLTRENDKDLSLSNRNRKRSDLISRAYLINKTKPDLYLSIHINYLSDSRYKGLQIFYNNKNKENENIALSLTKHMKEKTYNVREPKYNNTYYMYKNITEPGVLIELGFLSNPDDRYRLTHEEYQDKLINNLTYSINEYFNEKS